jgi:Ni2+-binding GTPase involved in maturation of urease and hydrogenase
MGQQAGKLGEGVILKIVPHISDSQYLAVNKFVLANSLGLYYHIQCRYILMDSLELVCPQISMSKKFI